MGSARSAMIVNNEVGSRYGLPKWQVFTPGAPFGRMIKNFKTPAHFHKLCRAIELE